MLFFSFSRCINREKAGPMHQFFLHQLCPDQPSSAASELECSVCFLSLQSEHLQQSSVEITHNFTHFFL